MSRFVRPEVTILALSGGDTLTVRRRLTAGEARARVERWTEHDPASGELRPKLTRAGLATIVTYLLDWTLTDDAGRLVAIAGIAPGELEAVVDNLDPDSFNEIREAIEAHETAMQAEREAQKKNGWAAGVASDLAIARRCGWRYEWVTDLDADVYAVLVEALLAEQLEADK